MNLATSSLTESGTLDSFCERRACFVTSRRLSECYREGWLKIKVVESGERDNLAGVSDERCAMLKNRPEEKRCNPGAKMPAP